MITTRQQPLGYHLGSAKIHRLHRDRLPGPRWLAALGVLGAGFMYLRSVASGRLRPPGWSARDRDRPYCRDGQIDVVQEASEHSADRSF